MTATKPYSSGRLSNKSRKISRLKTRLEYGVVAFVLFCILFCGSEWVREYILQYVFWGLFIIITYCFLLRIPLLIIGFTWALLHLAVLVSPRMPRFRVFALKTHRLYKIIRLLLSLFLLIGSLSLYLLMLLWQPEHCRILTVNSLFFLLLILANRYQLRSVLISLLVTIGLSAAVFIEQSLFPVIFWSVVSGSAMLALRWVIKGFKPALPNIPLFKGTVIVLLAISAVICIDIKLDKAHAPSPELNVLFGPGHPLFERFDNHRLFDLKSDAGNNRLFFSDKTAGVIGRIDLASGQVKLSRPIFSGVEQLVLRDDDQKLLAFTKAPFAFYVLSTDSLAEQDQCYFHLSRKGVLGGFFGGLLDIAAAASGNSFLLGFNDLSDVPSASYMAATLEFHLPSLGKRTNLYWIQYDKCLAFPARLKTNIDCPYQTLCSQKYNTCYISGMFFSSHLLSFSYDPGAFPLSSKALFIGPFSLGMALDETRGLLFVARPMSWFVDVIDMSSFSRIRRIPTRPMVRAVACAPKLDMLFWSEYYTGIVHVNRISTSESLFELRIGPKVREMVWDDGLETLFLLDEEHIYSIGSKELTGMEESIL